MAKVGQRPGGQALLATAGAALLLLAVGLGGTPYLLRLATEILLVGTAVMGLNFLVGQAGLESLGHGALFGGAAYAAALLAQHVGAAPVAVLAVGVASGVLLALVMGLLTLRVSGIYFLVVTLIAAQLLWEVVFHWHALTGGADGLRGFAGSGRWQQPRALFVLATAWAAASWLALRTILRRPAGLAMQALRDEPLRLLALGYSHTRIRLLAFVVAGAATGGAGALYPFINGYISPEAVHWSFSAVLLVMGVIGGIRSLAGAWVGAAVYLLCQTYISSWTDRWQLVVGLIFVAVVLFMPQGIVHARRPAPEAAS